MAGKYFNHIASATGTEFAQTNVARSGNLHNSAADGAAANTLNATTVDKQLRLLSDFHVINGYLATQMIVMPKTLGVSNLITLLITRLGTKKILDSGLRYGEASCMIRVVYTTVYNTFVWRLMRCYHS